jgi:hypothetical protein
LSSSGEVAGPAVDRDPGLRRRSCAGPTALLVVD